MTDYKFYEDLEDPTHEEMSNWIMDLTADYKEQQKEIERLQTQFPIYNKKWCKGCHFKQKNKCQGCFTGKPTMYKEGKL